MHPAVPIALVFVGCCSNVVFLELLIRGDPGSGNIITFSQFLFIALEGFVTTARFGTKKPSIPIRHYIVMVVMFFLVNVTNNLALNYNISMPLHMIFRAGSLIANLVMGIIILKKRYTTSKYLSVLMITAGICISTIASGKDVGHGSTEEEKASEFFSWCIGISLLTFALFLSARMGIYQETLYVTYGKHPNEALFYSHALPLPGFIVLASDIYTRAAMFSTSELVTVPGLNIGVPCMWLYLIGNVVTQYVCISSVYVLTTECTSLTVTLVVTLRKFISLLLSIVYFQNPFTPTHWVGTFLVFLGTCIFINIISMARELFAPKRKVN